MAMNYSSLIAPKGTAGSIANFISYTKVQPEVPTILDEAQGLLYTLLRVREMRTRTRFTMLQGYSVQPLPVNFLDPIGPIQILDWNLQSTHRDESWLAKNRNYEATTGALGTDPFTTAFGSAGSPAVNVALTNHGFNQDSSFYTTGATAFNGVTIVGTFNISNIIDANNFTIDITPLGVLPNASGSGGGSAVTYQCDNLVLGTPLNWAIYNEQINFDFAFDQQVICELMHFQSLPLLSSTNQTNFLTNRYPHLIRPACQAQAAAFMRDDAAYQREVTRLTAITQAVNAENDMVYRGMVLETDTP